MVNVKDLHKENKIQEDENKKLYKKIYKLLETNIVSNNKKNVCECYFEVSLFYFGMPLYSIDDCVKYIKKKLVKNGFKVEILGKNGIHVKW